MTSRAATPLLAASLALSAGALVVVSPPLAALALATSLGTGLLLAVLRSALTETASDRRWLVRWASVSFGLHLLLSIAITFWPPALTYLGADSLTYHFGAEHIVDHWRDGYDFPRLPTGKEGFFYLLAVLYAGLGGHIVAGLAVNAAFSACLVPLMYDSTNRLFGRESGTKVVPLVALLPSFLVFTSQLLREPGVLLLMALAFNAAIRIMRKSRFRDIILLALSLSLLLTFRANVAYVFAFGLLAGLAFSRTRLLTGLGTAASIAALSLLLTLGVGIGYSGYRLSTEAGIEEVATIRLDSSRASSGFARNADIASPGKALIFLPRGTVNFLAGPFPWQVRDMRHAPAIVDAAVLWVLAPSLVRGTRLAVKTYGKSISVILVPALLLTVMLSLFIGNFGTIVRERLQIVLLLLPLIALGRASRSTRAARLSDPGADSGLAPVAR